MYWPAVRYAKKAHPSSVVVATLVPLGPVAVTGTTYAQPAVTQANCAASNAGVTGAAYGVSW